MRKFRRNRGLLQLFFRFLPQRQRYLSNAKRTRKNLRKISNHRFRRPSDTYIRPPKSLRRAVRPQQAVRCRLWHISTQAEHRFRLFFRRRLCPPPPLYMRATPRPNVRIQEFYGHRNCSRPNRRQCLPQALFLQTRADKARMSKQAQRKIRQAFSAFLQPPAKSSYATFTDA